jgi:hypothetical protein
LIVKIESAGAAGDGLGDGGCDGVALALAAGDAVGVVVETPVGIALAAAVAVGVAVAWLGGLPASDGVSTDEPPLQPAAAIRAAVVAPTQSARAKKFRSPAKRLTIHTYS